MYKVTDFYNLNFSEENSEMVPNQTMKQIIRERKKSVPANFAMTPGGYVGSNPQMRINIDKINLEQRSLNITANSRNRLIDQM